MDLPSSEKVARALSFSPSHAFLVARMSHACPGMIHDAVLTRMGTHDS